VDIRVLFGTRLKQLREERELTQEQLAEAIGITPQQLSEIERGKHGTSFKRLTKLAKALEVPVHCLFVFTEEPDI
jgi:transcriptional regulator with XRE-family HTH domain